MHNNCLEVLTTGRVKSDAVRLEASTLCQLKCPVCIHNNGTRHIVGQGYLKFSDFKKFIDRHPFIKHIELSNWGEIFLNPELKYIILYSRSKGIFLSAVNGVNLNTVSPDMLRTLVKYKFRRLTIAIDGASQEVYSLYRLKGDFNKVIENIKLINYYKRKYRSELPNLCWQFVVFGHNEGDVETAKNMAKKLDMDFYAKYNYARSYSPVKNVNRVKHSTPFLSLDDYEGDARQVFMSACSQLWLSPQINWDGKLLGCCVNYWDDFGDVFKDGLAKCIESPRYVNAKKSLLGIIKPRSGLPCLRCLNYKIITSTKNGPGVNKLAAKWALHNIFMSRWVSRQ